MGLHSCVSEPLTCSYHRKVDVVKFFLFAVVLGVVVSALGY